MLMRLITTTIIMATPVFADVTLEPDCGEAIACVVHKNNYEYKGANTRFYTLEIPDYGNVVVQETNTSGNNPDSIEIIELPSGVIADRYEATTEETETSVIELHEFMGF